MIRTSLLLLLWSSFAFAAPGKTVEASKEVQNPMFGYTHMLPSPYTLPAGRLVLGTSVGFGLTDFFQVGTDILRDFYKVWNANAKLGVLDFEAFALALTFGWESFNYRDLSSKNPDVRITSWQPGVTTGYSLAEELAWFVGGNLSFTDITQNSDGIQTSGYMRGATFETDLSWAYNPKKRGIGNVLSGGVTFDASYKLFGLGISHHWPGFHLGAHYYPGADENKLQPIISGGAVVDL